MESTISTSASTLRSLHINAEHCAPGMSSESQPSSPRSSALPSPPNSPSESVSSLPSVSSSFFFSSAAASPPHSNPPSDHAKESTQGLIIPSLTLPSALRRPTPYGQTIGDMRLLVLGGKGAGKSFLSAYLLEDNEDVVEVGAWEEMEHGMVLRASTDWVEHRDPHGLEKFEPARNVEILELPGYNENDDAHCILQSLLSIIQTPFYTIREIIHPNRPASTVLGNLLSSPNTPLHTALIFLLSSSPTLLEQQLIDHLSPQIPIIVLPRLSGHNRHPSRPSLSSFRPMSAMALKAGLFRSPDILSTLRSEASDRFLRWREVEHAVESISSSHTEYTSLIDAGTKDPDGLTWTKSKWESEWEASLSQDVAGRMRDGTVTEKDRPWSHSVPSSCAGSVFDPLHLPSLFMFSLSLVGPVQHRVGKSLSTFAEKMADYQVRLALLGGFCVGIGLGFLLR